MGSKKCDYAECCEKNIIHDVVSLEDGIEFEYDDGGDDLNGYVLLIIDKIRKKESQQQLFNTIVDQLENLETDHEELQKKAKVKKTKSELVEDLINYLILTCMFSINSLHMEKNKLANTSNLFKSFLMTFLSLALFHVFLNQLSTINQ
ncbi:hypothetical protein ACOSQ2_017450 [Xanthoceras sorbifolium]